jgi:hypothetical protein
LGAGEFLTAVGLGFALVAKFFDLVRDDQYAHRCAHAHDAGDSRYLGRNAPRGHAFRVASGYRARLTSRRLSRQKRVSPPRAHCGVREEE